MKTLATVVEIKQENIAVVSVARHAACDGCHKNADGTGCSVCTLLGGKREAHTKALNAVGAVVGDTVEVESRTGRMLFYAALVFLLPVLMALGGYAIGWHLTAREGIALGIAALGFALSLVGVWLFSRLVIAGRLDVEIVRVVRSACEAPDPEDGSETPKG